MRAAVRHSSVGVTFKPPPVVARGGPKEVGGGESPVFYSIRAFLSFHFFFLQKCPYTIKNWIVFGSTTLACFRVLVKKLEVKPERERDAIASDNGKESNLPTQ